MELAKTYSPTEIETKWYSLWEESGYFKPTINPNAPSYAIHLPPPNVTGTLHMGHGFQHTIQDALIRYHRMRGYNTLWQPGTDHAGIATQIVVERQLEAKGLNRKELGRDEFLRQVWLWNSYSGGTITKQMRRLGASCDWSRERFTMDEDLSSAVIEVFVTLHERGYIYRGNRLVNWDVKRQTAVSDLEVTSTEEMGSLWHFKYPIKGHQNTKDKNSKYIEIATTRPETMLGDVAVAVNPNDPRYQHLIGSMLILPLVGREIPIIADDYVDMEFGTGCVKITPAHDFNDYEIGKRHKLPIINILTLDGHINENAPTKYQGMERFAARRQIVADLQELGLVSAIKPHKLMVPRGERDEVILEPMLTNQWFMNMEKMAQDALDVVKRGEVRFVPDNWQVIYNQWLENIQDWCISRQLWWGHRIPAYYNEEGEIFVARDLAAAIAVAKTDKLTQDEDVLDTWFSSALWSFSTLGWPADTPELEAFLPSSVLVTGFDIIFFWVARMVMLTREFTGKVPFRDVYVTGLIQDAHGQKMSKSKGNVIDPLDLIDGITLEELIQKRATNLMNPKQAESVVAQTKKDYPGGFMAFGADALRFTFTALATHGRELRFDIRRVESSRNFCNKLWNAARFMMMNAENHRDLIIDYTKSNKPELSLSMIDSWIMIELHGLIAEIDFAYATYRFDILAQKLYEFVWNDYCDWYLELAKVNLQSDDVGVRSVTINLVIQVLECVLRLLHPVMPFITEEIWQELNSFLGVKNVTSIMIANAPTVKELNYEIDNTAMQNMSDLKELVIGVRNLCATMNLSPSAKVPLIIEVKSPKLLNEITKMIPYLQVLAKLSSVKIVEQLQSNSESAVAVVLGQRLMLEVVIDIATEKLRLTREITKLTIELDKIKIKLDNPTFIGKAPKELVERDTKRMQEVLHTLVQINSQLDKYS
jgi:valyl-tRNA synthetase